MKITVTFMLLFILSLHLIFLSFACFFVILLKKTHTSNF